MEVNELNPVAALILEATVVFPVRFGVALKLEFERIGSRFVKEVKQRLAGTFPDEPEQIPVLMATSGLGRLPVPTAKGWCRCRRTGGLLLALACDLAPILGNGPGSKGRRCSFQIVDKFSEQSLATVADGDATCPFRIAAA